MAKKRLELMRPIQTTGIKKASKEIHGVISWLTEAKIEERKSLFLFNGLQIKAAKFLALAVRSLMVGDFQTTQKLVKVALVTMDQLKD